MTLSAVTPITDLNELPGLLSAALATLDEHAIVAITDVHGRICYANQKFCELSQYTLQELIGEDHRILNSGTHSREFMKTMWRTIGQGGVWRGCFCNRAKDGSLYWVQSTIVPLLSELEKPTHYISMRTDVSDLMLAEQALRDSERRFRTLFEQSADALLLLDVDQGVFLEVNTAAARMLGYDSPESVLRHTPAEFSPVTQPDGEDSGHKAIAMMMQAREQGSHRFEWLHSSPHRKPFPVEVVLTMLQRGEGSLCLTTWRDITERKRTEAWQLHYTTTLDALVKEESVAVLLDRILQFACQQAPHLALAVYATANRSRIMHITAVGVDAVKARKPYQCHRNTSDQPCPLLITGEPAMEPCNTLDCSALADEQGKHLVALQPILSPRHDAALGNLAIFLDQDRPLKWHEQETIDRSLSLLALVIERVKAREQQQFAEVVFRESDQAIALTDQRGKLLTINAAFTQLLGLADHELTGRGLADTLRCLNDPALQQQIELAIQTKGRWQGEVDVVDAQGSRVPVHYTQTRVTHDAARFNSRIHILVDLTDKKRQAAEIERLSSFDELTCLPNRMLMNVKLAAALTACQERSQSLALLCVDLDRFKEVNDVRGHTIGDAVLVEVANRFRHCLDGQVLARTGGDEFAVIGERLDEAQAVQLAVSLQQSLVAPLNMDSHPITLGASIGVALFPQDGDDAEELLRKAEMGMYRAKTEGGGYRFYQDTMGRALTRQLAVAAKLRKALDDDQLALHYQPVVRLSDECLVAAEGLLRWHDPHEGAISPAEFIPIAEARNMMPELGLWVFERACRDLRAWQQAGYCVPAIAINLSAIQFANRKLPLVLHSVLVRYGLKANAFELEITESSIIVDPEGAIDLMKQLVGLGFSLAIDDFGTGYSSLSYLKRFPARKLKIDQSFVHDMLEDANDRAIVETVIAMASALQLKTVAEGVEQVEQLQVLEQLGCDAVQGWHYAKALDAATFEQQWLRGR